MRTKTNSGKTPPRLTPPRLLGRICIASIGWIAMTLAAGFLSIQIDRSLERSFPGQGYTLLISTALAGDKHDDAEKARKREEKARKREEKRRKKELKRARKEEKKRRKAEEKKRRKAEEKRRKRERHEAENRRHSDEDRNRRERDNDREQERADSRDSDRDEQRSDNSDDDRREESSSRNDSNNSDSDSNDGDSNRNNRDGDDNDDNRRADRNLEEEENVKPPATIVELIKRIVKPKRKKRKFSGGFSLGRPTFRPHEVLAANLSARSIKRAKRLGFKVKKGAHLSSLGMNVNRLIAPPGMDARRARRLLRQEMPRDSFTLNQLYRIHPAARGTQRKRSTGTPLAPGKARSKCRGDRCYATSVMKWRPRLRSCAKKVKVGLIDTAIDHDHPAFRGRRVQIGKFIPPGRKAASKWHGTGVLAVLGGNSNTSTPGLIPGSEFYVANAFFTDKTGTPVADSVSMLNALDWMDAFNVNVVNLSVAGPKDPLVEKAIARLSKKGVIFVAAAGNNGPSAPPSYPAAYRQVIAVTAVNKKLSGYRYANRGSYIDLAAPGVDIWTAIPKRREGYQSGTSFAVPYVTAVVAAIYQQTSARTKEQFLDKLRTRDLGRPGRDKIYGRGLVMAPERCRPDPARPHSIAKASALGRR